MSSASAGEALVRRFWDRMAANDWAHAAALFAPRFEILMPQSGEAIRTVSGFVAINRDYPAAGRWQFSIEHLVAGDSEVATVVAVTDGVRADRVVSFFALAGDRIVRITEYWPDAMPAPDWRKPFVEAI